ncbi:MAG: CheR family methyltransferase [Bdellovibrionota bacterium]
MCSEENFDIEVKLLIEAIYEKYSYDFRSYAMASVKRRLHMILNKYKFRTVSRLQEKILYDPNFFLSVLQFLTITTTEMFRDPFYYLTIRENVIPILKTYPSLKIWIAGCSTGEEVYSFAILLQEEGLLECTTIYATDINPVSIKKAEDGIFSAENIKEYESNYKKSGGKQNFSDYFVVSYGAALFDKSLKKNIVFADHSLATDSVFSEMQMISCRNVLIYFSRELQEHALGLFSGSLCRSGFLGLGSKETIRFSSHFQCFNEFSKQEKIYQKK